MNIRSRLVGAFASTALGATLLAAAAPMIVGCGVDQQVYDAAIKDRDQQKQKLAEAQAANDAEKVQHKKDVGTRDQKIDVLSKKLESLGQDVSRLETERGNLGGELETAKKRMEELRKAQAQAEARASQFRKLVSQFKQLTDAGKLQVELRENRMIVRLGDQILFDPGKTELKKEGEDALRQVTDVLKAIPNRNFQVAGPHRQHPDQVEALPLELGPVDGARRRGRQLHDRERHGAEASVGRRLRRPVAGRRRTTRRRTRPRTGASRSRWCRTWTTCRRSTKRSRRARSPSRRRRRPHRTRASARGASQNDGRRGGLLRVRRDRVGDTRTGPAHQDCRSRRQEAAAGRVRRRLRRARVVHARPHRAWCSKAR